MLLLGLSACERTVEKTAAPVKASQITPPKPGASIAPLAPEPAQTILSPAPAVEPAPDPSPGVLASRKAPPSGGPHWLSIRAEIIEREGKRILRTSHFASRINNASLARQTAANRARHELTKWLGGPTLEGARVTDHHWNPTKQLSSARAEVELPDSWIPTLSTLREDTADP